MKDRSTQARPRGRAAATNRRQAAASRAAGVATPLQLRHVLVPMDYSPPAFKALRYALSFAELYGAKVTILNVIEPAIYPAEVGVVPAEIKGMYASMRREAQKRINEFSAREIPERHRAKALVRMGTPCQEIIAVAGKLKTDLVVIATHGYTGVTHMLMGSTAEHVVRHAPCPVLTVREQEQDFA